ncbi:MAG TPA: hypothetical protein PLJ22_03015, partial [Kiritimatiellia bacterium]|nr:hypothetical protein [Kiritimatiellia bacterium]
PNAHTAASANTPSHLFKIRFCHFMTRSLFSSRSQHTPCRAACQSRFARETGRHRHFLLLPATRLLA